MAELRMALIRGRHQIPQAVDGSIFHGDIEDVTAVEKLERLAFDGIWNGCFRHHKAGESGFLRTDDDWDGSDMEPLYICSDVHLHVYVTGLTIATTAVINNCIREGIQLTLWHYDRESESYYPQEMATVKPR